MFVLASVSLLLSSGIKADTPAPSIEDVQARPYSFDGVRLRLCGEVTQDGGILYSDTTYPIHGRVGIRLRGFAGRGRDQCVTGLLFRTDGRVRSKTDAYLVTDSPVPPEHVLFADPG